MHVHAHVHTCAYHCEELERNVKSTTLAGIREEFAPHVFGQFEFGHVLKARAKHVTKQNNEVCIGVSSSPRAPSVEHKKSATKFGSSFNNESTCAAPRRWVMACTGMTTTQCSVSMRMFDSHHALAAWQMIVVIDS